MKRNPYEILGVNLDATDRDIQKAFRKKSFSCHPDFYPDDDAKKKEFEDLTDAYQKINSEEKRKQLKRKINVNVRSGSMGAAHSYYDDMFKV